MAFKKVLKYELFKSPVKTHSISKLLSQKKFTTFVWQNPKCTSEFRIFWYLQQIRILTDREGSFTVILVKHWLSLYIFFSPYTKKLLNEIILKFILVRWKYNLMFQICCPSLRIIFILSFNIVLIQNISIIKFISFHFFATFYIHK